MLSFDENILELINAIFSGDFNAGIPLPNQATLEERETTLEGDEKECFLHLVRQLLQWEPDKRGSPKELAYHEWILKHT